MAADGTVTLFLPCDVVRFRASVDLGPGVSPIEEIALQALATLPMTVGKLTTLLALPQPVVTEVIHTLWRHGQLAVEPGSGTLRIGRDAVAADGIAAAGESEREECILELMVDLWLGQALPPEGRRHASAPQCVDPPHDGADVAEIPAADLLRAATLAMRRTVTSPGHDLPAAANRRVVDLRPEPGRPGRRWRPVLVQPWLEELTGALGVTVVDLQVPPAFREAGSARLTGLAADNPDAPFTKLLRLHAVSGAPEVPTAESLAATLVELAARLPGLPYGQRTWHHEQLAETAAQLAQSLESRIGSETEAELVTGGRLAQAAANLIDQSHIQVVVVASELSPAAAGMLVPRLQAARERGVQVVMLLDSERPPSAALRELAGAGGLAPLVLSRQPASAWAGLVIRDDDAALMLAGTTLGADDAIGVALSAQGGGVCPTVRAVLSWIGSAAPDETTAKAILPRPSGREPGTAPLEAARLGQLPEAPPADATGGAAVVAWEAAWRAYAAGQREILRARSLPQARWITSASHHEMLGQVLRVARRRLVIASPLISDRVVDHQFLAMLRGRLERGVMVTLTHRSSAGSGPAALDVLAAEFPGTLFLATTPAEIRALVWDDDAVLLTAEPLAGNPLAAGSVAGRSPLGLRLTGAAIADLIASAAGEPAVVTTQVTGTENADAREPGLLARIRVLNTAQRIRNRWHEDRSVDRALEPLAAENNPWPVLESLTEEFADGAAQGMGDELVCAAAAWCLTHADHADSTTVDRWQQWLIHYHWRARRFAEAALLRLAHPPSTAPRPPLTVVAAAFGTDVSTMALLTALEHEDRFPAEDACLLCVAAAESLRTADDDHAEIVRRLVSRVGAPWRDLGAAVLEYHAVARGIPPELLIRPAADRSARSRRLTSAWDALARAIDRGQRQQAQAGFADQRRLQAALFKRSGTFGPLGTATTRRDADAVRAFLASHSAFGDSDGQTVSRIIDEVLVSGHRQHRGL